MTQEPKLVVIYKASGLLEANIVKGRLECEGIPVLLSYESLGPVAGLTVDGLGEVRLLVPQDFAELARELAESDERGSLQEA